MVRTKKKVATQLTTVELEMMNIIWSLDICTVHQIMERLPKERDLAYTTVSTMVRILEQKQFVSSKKIGRGHIYQAQVSKKEYESSSITHLINNVFQGQPTQLVSRLLSSDGLTQDEIKDIQNLIEQSAKK